MQKFEFELSVSGQGPALLMLPGSYATPAAWKGIRASLTSSFRIFSTSLPGYGSTAEIRVEDHPHVDPMIEFVGQVVDAAGEPVHVIGHSWGAHLALAAILRGRISPLSLVCFEANPIYARPLGKPFEWRADVDAIIDQFQAALLAGDPNAAAIIIDFYSRTGAFESMPGSVRSFCQATAPTNLLDWFSAATFTPRFDEFNQLNLAVTLARGDATPKPIVDVTDQLAQHIPNVCTQVVEGADHFLISTHPAECAKIMESHFLSLADNNNL